MRCVKSFFCALLFSFLKRKAKTEPSGLVGDVPALCRAPGRVTFGGPCHPKPFRASRGAGRRRGGPSSGITGILLPPCAHPAPPASVPARPAPARDAAAEKGPASERRGLVLLQKCSSHGRALGQTLSFTLRSTSQA